MVWPLCVPCSRVDRQLPQVSYTAADLLPLCADLDVPLVFDYHHDMLNPSHGLVPAEITERANRIFQRRGIQPKQHYSESREGAMSITERRAHSNRCRSLPTGLPDDMGTYVQSIESSSWLKLQVIDLMIEAKDKEQAVLQLYKTYDLY